MRQRNGKENNRTAFWLFVLCFAMILPLTVPCLYPMQSLAQESVQLQKTTQTAEALKAFRGKEQLLRSQAAADLDVYPEYAMYMADPQRILNAFMMREKGYRVQIDHVQHNIGGYYLYWRNYDRLTAYQE